MINYCTGKKKLSTENKNNSDSKKILLTVFNQITAAYRIGDYFRKKTLTLGQKETSLKSSNGRFPNCKSKFMNIIPL